MRPRVYNRFPYVSEKIFRVHVGAEREGFDPILVKVFINMLGIYPLGTLVLLNTRMRWESWSGSEESAEFIDRPRIFLLSYSDGEYRRGSIVDLREMDERTKEYKRNIVRTLDPNEYNIDVAGISSFNSVVAQ